MYFITTKRMLEVCFSAHPNIQYRTFYIFMKNSYIFDFHIENMVKGCYVKKASCRFQAGEEENAVNINKRQGRIVYAEVKEEDMDGKAGRSGNGSGCACAGRGVCVPGG